MISIILIAFLLILSFSLTEFTSNQSIDDSFADTHIPVVPDIPRQIISVSTSIDTTTTIPTKRPLHTTSFPTGKPSKSKTSNPTPKPIEFNQNQNDNKEWTVDWTLANSIHNLTETNVSESVIWQNDEYNGYCGTQLHPILTNANGLEYFWVHDVMSIEIGTKVWIFATDPSSVFHRDTQPPIWLGLYNSYFICAFNDGTTVLSDQIKFMRKKNLVKFSELHFLTN